MSTDAAAEVFVYPSRRANHGVGYLIAGVVFCGVAVLGLLLAIKAQVDQLALQGLTTMPAIIGVMGLIAGWRALRNPREVRIGQRGIVLFCRNETRKCPWEEIAFAMTDIGFFRERRLRIYDASGHLMASLTDALEGFPDLVARVDERVAARTDDAGARIRLGKARRLGTVCGIFGLVFIAAGGFLAWQAREDARAKRLLRNSAVPGNAEIVERFIAPNGVTARLVYRVTSPDGLSATRNAEVERAVWDTLKGQKTVPVIYVPDEPSISRLVVGERKESRQLEGYIGPILGSAMGLFLIGMSILLWCGYGIDLDSKTGRISIKPYGTGR
ncbi:MAG TPA: hypothetical protein VEI07_00220 [Planctomycetaceae bacterium]|nr:hypothetical protein [Planctomycetaceae bacterium]